MAKFKNKTRSIETRGFRFGFNFRTMIIAAGLMFVVPYLVRRLRPLIEDYMDTDLGDVIVAGKDAVRDVADDLGIGGVSGKVSRGADRVGDRLSH